MKRTQTKYGSIAVAVEECTVMAGGTVCGDVVVEVTKPVAAFTGVIVNLRGTVSTVIQRGAGEDRDNHYDTAEVCSVATRYVPEEVKASYDAETSCYSLPAGEYRLPFQIDVPLTAPQTDKLQHQSPDAKVAYVLGAIVALPGNGGVWNAVKEFFNRQSVMKKIIVLPTHNPRLESINAEPHTFQKSKSFTMSRSKGEVAAKVKLERQFYHPGEQVHFTVDVINDSTKLVKKASLAIVTTGHVLAMSYRDDYKRTVIGISLPEAIAAGESRSFDASLEIPSTFEKFSMITPLWAQQFAVSVTLHTSGLTRNLEASALVHILPSGETAPKQMMTPGAPADNSRPAKSVTTHGYDPAPGLPTPVLTAVPVPQYAEPQ